MLQSKLIMHGKQLNDVYGRLCCKYISVAFKNSGHWTDVF